VHANQHWAQVLRSNGDGTFTQVFLQANQSGGPFQAASSNLTYPLDYNGDGLTDILQVHANQHWAHVLRSNGDGTFAQVFLQANQSGGPFQAASSNQTYPLDYNGDGLTDILQVHANQHWAQAISPTGIMANQLQSVTANEAKTQVLYRSLSSVTPPYVKDAVTSCGHPCMNFQAPMYVVSEVKSSNGLGIAGAGGEYRSTYRYAGAKADQHGRGFLGFRQMTVKDEQTGVEQTTSYRQDYPFTGLVASREKKLDAQLLNRSSNTYGSTNLGGTRRYPFLTQSLEESWELTGAALPAVTTSHQYDSYGNATQVGVSTGDGHSKTTTNTYSNDNTNWLLGRLTRSEVTSTMPGN
jgi:hypothetical protein